MQRLYWLGDGDYRIFGAATKVVRLYSSCGLSCLGGGGTSHRHSCTENLSPI